MRKKFFNVFLFFNILLVGILVGCGTSDNNSDAYNFSYSMNIIPEEFEEKYSHYEKELIIQEDSKEISITGQVESGEIDIQIFDENDNTKSYSYKITGVTQETISLDGNESTKWTAIIDYYRLL